MSKEEFLARSRSYGDVRQKGCVGSFNELLTTPLADGVNALCWPRALSGDFDEVVSALGQSAEGIGDGVLHRPSDIVKMR